ncbi:hypothetical protein [Maricaulis sp.]|uniref:hypothetical protein n=1 Tax=Maricaulis sp. TaxID=1486257 RepID=UPI00262E1E4A|nr:hypothetical protein [Maricaulis sp.]
MRTSLFALALACALPAAGQAQFESDQETLNIQAVITELENLTVTKQTDLDFGDVLYLVTDVSGTGTYGWSSLDVIHLGGGNLGCTNSTPNANGVQIVQQSTTSGAGLTILTDEGASITLSFTGVLDPTTDPRLTLTRSGGAETLEVGQLRYNTAFYNGSNIVNQTLRSSFEDLSIVSAGIMGVCVYGTAELTNGLATGLYATTFEVTATYN